MSKVYVSTVTYNNETTIGKAIESILNQTHTDWEYHITNNASTDKTGKIIEEYAQKDSRIKTYHNDKNSRELNELLAIQKNYMHNLKEDEYFCWLDGDDEYESNFMEDTLSYAKENNLDIVITGTEQLDSKTGEHLRYVNVSNFIADENNFTDFFVSAAMSISHVWGILYNHRAASNYTLDNNDFTGGGGDAYVIWNTIDASDRIGFLDGSYYKYYVNPHSQAKKSFNLIRLESSGKINDKVRDVISKKVAVLSEPLENTLTNLFVHHLNYSVYVLYESDLSIVRKIEGVTKVLFNKRFQQAIESSHDKTNAKNILNYCSKILGQGQKVIKGKSIDKAIKRYLQLNKMC